jgi:hypothetical protein
MSKARISWAARRFRAACATGSFHSGDVSAGQLALDRCAGQCLSVVDVLAAPFPAPVVHRGRSSGFGAPARTALLRGCGSRSRARHPPRCWRTPRRAHRSQGGQQTIGTVLLAGGSCVMSISPNVSCDATSTAAVPPVYQLRAVVHSVSPLIWRRPLVCGRRVECCAVGPVGLFQAVFRETASNRVGRRSNGY